MPPNMRCEARRYVLLLKPGTLRVVIFHIWGTTRRRIGWVSQTSVITRTRRNGIAYRRTASGFALYEVRAYVAVDFADAVRVCLARKTRVGRGEDRVAYWSLDAHIISGRYAERKEGMGNGSCTTRNDR